MQVRNMKIGMPLWMHGAQIETASQNLASVLVVFPLQRLLKRLCEPIGRSFDEISSQSLSAFRCVCLLYADLFTAAPTPSRHPAPTAVLGQTRDYSETPDMAMVSSTARRTTCLKPENHGSRWHRVRGHGHLTPRKVAPLYPQWPVTGLPESSPCL